MTMNTTLEAIRQNSPPHGLVDRLIKAGGHEQGSISIANMLRDDGQFSDAIWALRTVPGYAKRLQRFGLWSARQVQHLLIDRRSQDALDVAERHATGEASDEELEQAIHAAEAVAMAVNVSDHGTPGAAAAWAAMKATQVARNPSGVTDAADSMQLALAPAAGENVGGQAWQSARLAQAEHLQAMDVSEEEESDAKSLADMWAARQQEEHEQQRAADAASREQEASAWNRLAAAQQRDQEQEEAARAVQVRREALRFDRGVQAGEEAQALKKKEHFWGVAFDVAFEPERIQTRRREIKAAETIERNAPLADDDDLGL